MYGEGMSDVHRCYYIRSAYPFPHPYFHLRLSIHLLIPRYSPTAFHPHQCPRSLRHCLARVSSTHGRGPCYIRLYIRCIAPWLSSATTSHRSHVMATPISSASTTVAIVPRYRPSIRVAPAARPTHSAAVHPLLHRLLLQFFNPHLSPSQRRWGT